MKLGGTEKHVIALAAGMRDSGHDVKILTLFRPGVLAGDVEKKALPFECLQLPYRWGFKPFKALLDFFTVNSPDIVQTYLFGFDLFGLAPAWMKKIPVLISSRREIPGWQETRHRLLVNVSNRFVKKVVCCSMAVREWVLRHESVNREKVLAIYNGVDSQLFHSDPVSGRRVRLEFNIPESAYVAGTVANFGVEKGYPQLLKAAAKTLKANPSLWFLFVGDGPLRSKMESEANLLFERNRIVFTGFRSDIPGLLNSMDLFIQPSLEEGMPNAVYEAMACGRPVIATRVGGVPEILENGRDALLISPGQETEIFEAILKLVADPELCSRLAENARRKIETNFSMTAMINQYENLYRELVS